MQLLKSHSKVRRDGISLLEVLMTIFIIAVGLASVFALFMAGREIDARTTRQTEAAAVAQSIGEPLADEWCDVLQWIYLAPPTVAGEPNTWQWVRTSAGVLPKSLPVLIDPWGLVESETDLVGSRFDPVVQLNTLDRDPPNFQWGFDRFLPIRVQDVNDPNALHAVQPFSRITIAPERRTTVTDTVPASGTPLSREQITSLFASPDAVEYGTIADELAPPQPLFELGRRKRGTNFFPALFLCKPPEAGSGDEIALGTALERWLLVFHKPVASYQERLDVDGVARWPAGVHRLPVGQNSFRDLLELAPDPVFLSSDSTDIARAYQPGKWILIIQQRLHGGKAVFDACWRRLISATKEPGAPPKWLLGLEEELPGQWWDSSADPPKFTNLTNVNGTLTGLWVFGFESLIHVKRLPLTTLTGL